MDNLLRDGRDREVFLAGNRADYKDRTLDGRAISDNSPYMKHSSTLMYTCCRGYRVGVGFCGSEVLLGLGFVGSGFVEVGFVGVGYCGTEV